MSNYITLTAPGTPAATWFKAVQTSLTTTQNLEMRFTINRTTLDPAWAVVLGYTASDSYYLMGVNASRKPFVLRVTGSTTKTLIEMPNNAPLDGEVIVSFRQRRFLEDASDVWHCFGLWMNGTHVMSHVEAANGILTNPMMGFAAYTSSTITYDEITIPQMTEFADWISLDPGESPQRALERAIEGRYVKYFVRWDGRLRAWIPKATNSIYTYSTIMNKQRKFDARELKTHIRLLGAYVQAEFVRRDLVSKYGHRFAEVSNPYLITEEECYQQAELSIKRMEEAADVLSLDVLYNPVLEPEDHIIAEDDRIIDSRSISISLPQVKESQTARKYTYGS